jgi:predicted O-linked N-acetylglucosamine transferase (SPINDLY family)
VTETAQRIRADEIDILVDLHGWTADGRPEALALRCAPVQVNWLGYAGTTGHPKLADYLLGDPVVTPLQRTRRYTETLAHLPNCYLPADDTIAPWVRRRRGVMPGCRRRASFSARSTTATSSTRRSSTSGAACCGKLARAVSG